MPTVKKGNRNQSFTTKMFRQMFANYKKVVLNA